MSPSDDFQVKTTYGLDLKNKRVSVQWSQPVGGLNMPLDETLRMVDILLSCAKELDPEAVKNYEWPSKSEPTRFNTGTGAPAGGQPS